MFRGSSLTIRYVFLVATMVTRLTAGEENAVGFTFLGIRPDARSAAIGPMVAIPNAWSAFYNPAGIAFASGLGMSYNTNDYVANTSINYWTAGMGHTRFGSLAVNNYRFNYPRIERTNEENPDGTGEYYRPYENAFSASYAYAWSGWLAVGISHKWIYSKKDLFTAKAQFNDIGIMARLPLVWFNTGGYRNEISAGFSSINNRAGKKPVYKSDYHETIVDPMSNDTSFVFFGGDPIKVPRFDYWAFAYGLSYQSDAWRFTVFKGMIQLVYKDANVLDDELRVGTEWTIFDILSLRTQTKNFEKQKNKPRYKEKLIGGAYGASVIIPLKVLDISQWDITPRIDWTRSRGLYEKQTYTYWNFGIQMNFWNTK